MVTLDSMGTRNPTLAILLSVSCSALMANAAPLDATSDPRSTAVAAHIVIERVYSDHKWQLDHIDPPLRFLSSECHLPGLCGCWLLLDSANTSGAESDIGDWHSPKADFFRPPLRYFAMVSVRRIDSRAYSVLACFADWRKPKLLKDSTDHN
jgi:hypothetical protein